ncbi:hypothetical protein O181_082549 [Austropuccinia psidii MF-1]|uniref:Uncharacterized protein n=1 Tax=Austropuccinia psidii MF-1 TaxID=1389203 RepID=A0A9Q3FPH0_9BASI|nr:hypothetical protein [Austropuccinia psidii MF-1]
MQGLGNSSSSHSDFNVWGSGMGRNHALAYRILRISKKQIIISRNVNLDESLFPAPTSLPTQKPQNAQIIYLFSNLPYHNFSANERDIFSVSGEVFYGALEKNLSKESGLLDQDTPP